MLMPMAMASLCPWGHAYGPFLPKVMAATTARPCPWLWPWSWPRLWPWPLLLWQMTLQGISGGPRQASR